MNDSLDPIQQLISIAEQIRKLDPNPHPEHGNYIDISIGGYGEMKVRLFFSEEADLKNVKSMEDVRTRLQWVTPESVRAKRIATLKAELAKLEAA